MGNTKFVWFEGTARQESMNAFDPAELRKQSSGLYAASEIDPKGYLGGNKDDETDIYVVGIIHSYSMSGLRVVDYLKFYLTSGTIGSLDVDYPEMRIEVFCEDNQWAVVEKRVGGDLPRLGLLY